MRTPAVSVLIPTYNYARFLPEAVESVLEQDFQDFELLISDDCSADDAAGAAEPCCRRDNRVRFWRNPSNLGMVNNWNYCLEKARGKYIKFIFGDDKLAHPQALSKMVAQLESHPRAILAASARAIIDEESKINDICNGLSNGCHDGRQIIARCLVENSNLVGEPSAVLFRRADVHRFDPAYRQVPDLALWFEMLERGDLAYLRQPLCAFRRHPLQQSAINDRRQISQSEHMALMAKYAGRPGLSKQVMFKVLRGLRRARQHGQNFFLPGTGEDEQRIAANLGDARYFAFLLRHKFSRPFANLDRSIRKRLTRWRIHSAQRRSPVAAQNIVPPQPPGTAAVPQNQ